MPGAVTIDSRALFAPLLGRGGIGLAVSGGPDSLALLLLVAEWRNALPAAPPVFVYTVDHGLRPEAADEVRFVVAEAARLGLPGRALRWDGEKPATGIQAAARQARYRLMARAMAADGADLLLTAHHLGDQAETVLMRLAHGSGVEGLRGMQAVAFVEGCEIYRPLLGVEPADLRSMVERAGLTPLDDPSNRDSDYERVRWRKLMPQLSAMGLDARRLAGFARRMDELDAMVEGEAEAAHARLVHQPSSVRAELAHAGFAALHRPVAVRLLGRVLGGVGGGAKPHALAALGALHDKLKGGGALKRTSLHGCLISSDGSTIVVVREPGRVAARVAVALPADPVTGN